MTSYMTLKIQALRLLVSLKGLKKLLEKEDLASLKDKIIEYLDIIVKETIRMQELAISPNIEGRERVVDLTEVLKNRFRINEEAIKEMRKTNITLIEDHLEPNLFIYCSPFGLERVLDNLLDNATKAIPEMVGYYQLRVIEMEIWLASKYEIQGKYPKKT